MSYRKLLLTGTLSTLLTITTLFANGDKCVGGVCFVNINKLTASKGFKQNQKPLVVVQNPRYITDKSENISHNIEEIDKSVTIILDGEEIVVFPSYVATEAEKIAFYKQEQKLIALNRVENEKANEELKVITQKVEKIEDKILKKTKLPTSEFYCEKDTHPIYHQETDSYECS